VQAPLLSHWPVPQHDPGAHVVVPGAPEVLGHVVVTGEAIPLEWLVHIGASDLLRQNPAAQHQPALHCANGFGGRLRGVHPELTRELPPPRLPSQPLVLRPGLGRLFPGLHHGLVLGRHLLLLARFVFRRGRRGGCAQHEGERGGRSDLLHILLLSWTITLRQITGLWAGSLEFVVNTAG
jgi:hypothetical protein